MFKSWNRVIIIIVVLAAIISVKVVASIAIGEITLAIILAVVGVGALAYFLYYANKKIKKQTEQKI